MNTDQSLQNSKETTFKKSDDKNNDYEYLRTALRVSESKYLYRVRDNNALCEALRAIYSLYGEDVRIESIVNDVIEKHGV